MGQTAIITGASGGIGAACAKALASEGFDIGIHYRNGEARAKAVKDDVEALGQKAILLKADLSDAGMCGRIVEEFVQAFGNISVLVNNAGMTKDALVMRMTDEEFSSVIQANLSSCFYMTRAVLPYMLKAKQGRIVNVTSVIGLTGNAGQANYAASKAGLIGFSKSCAREVARKGICVNAVAPGYIITPMTDILDEALKKEIQSKIPMNRLGKPEDISGMVAFLCGDNSAYITGQVFVVDGGMVI